MKVIWYCDLYQSWIHGCFGCWGVRFLFIMLVVAPSIWLCFR